MPVSASGRTAVAAIRAISPGSAVVGLVACIIVAERARIVWRRRKVIIHTTNAAAASACCTFAPVLCRAAAFPVAVWPHCRRWALRWIPRGAAAGWALKARIHAHAMQTHEREKREREKEEGKKKKKIKHTSAKEEESEKNEVKEKRKK